MVKLKATLLDALLSRGEMSLTAGTLCPFFEMQNSFAFGRLHTADGRWKWKQTAVGMWETRTFELESILAGMQPFENWSGGKRMDKLLPVSRILYVSTLKKKRKAGSMVLSLQCMLIHRNLSFPCFFLFNGWHSNALFLLWAFFLHQYIHYWSIILISYILLSAQCDQRGFLLFYVGRLKKKTIYKSTRLTDFVISSVGYCSLKKKKKLAESLFAIIFTSASSEMLRAGRHHFRSNNNSKNCFISH